MIKITISAFFVFTCLLAQAQNNDRIITNAGDTIACEISHPFLGGASKYRTAKGVKAIKIKIDSLKGYYIADKTTWFRRVTYKNPNVIGSGVIKAFMTVVESGKINLYEMISTTNTYGANGMMYTNSNTMWFANKGTDTAIMIKMSDLTIFSGRKKRKSEFGDLLADNKAVYDKYMAEDKFSFEQIENLVHLYNTGEPYKPGGNATPF